MNKTFRIDCFSESALRCGPEFAVVAVDVIRATTMAVTAAYLGWRCYPVDSLNTARLLTRKYPNAVLAGEIDGHQPPEFHLNNSPAELAEMRDTSRPLILLSSSGTKLINNALHCDVVYMACFRNAAATARRLIQRGYPKIALLGAGSRGEFREEDQIGCAWIGAILEEAGYLPENSLTAQCLNRWQNAAANDCLVSKSVDYLIRTDQVKDLWFILDRINDIQEAYKIDAGGLVTRGGLVTEDRIESSIEGDLGLVA
jgi:2-phosphosulfolactate phosphatase